MENLSSESNVTSVESSISSQTELADYITGDEKCSSRLTMQAERLLYPGDRDSLQEAHNQQWDLLCGMCRGQLDSDDQMQEKALVGEQAEPPSVRVMHHLGMILFVEIC